MQRESSPPAASTSDAPSGAPAAAPAAAVAAPADSSSARSTHKRPRAAVDPGTPKGDEGDAKGPVGMTPLAKKNRIDDDSPAHSQASDDGKTTPPPSSSAAPASSSRPSTPAQAGHAVVPGTEGKETRKIRERVAATKLAGQEDDSSEQKEGEGKGEERPEAKQDTVLKDAPAVEGEEKPAPAPAASAGEKDVHIAEASQSAPAATKEEKDAAETAAEVGEAAAPVQAQDEKIAEDAAEVADAVKQAPEPTPAPTPKPAVAAQPTFSNYSATASPFAAYTATASPFAAVPTPSTAPSKAIAPFEGKPSSSAPAAAEEQKPKAKSSFSASPFAAGTLPPPVPSAPSSSSSTPAPPASSSSSATPSFTKAAATTNLAAASPFSAFASTSGFAAATGSSTPKPASSGAASAFSAFSATPSAFSSAKAGGKSALDSAKTEGSASPAPTSGADDEAGEKKPVFTEQERFTGEEDEEVLHVVRAKVFVMEEGQWKERGTGPLRVNQVREGKRKEEGSEAEKVGARLVMRADATHRLLLNAPLFKEFVIEVSNDKYVRFTALQDDTPVSYMLRTGNPAAAQNLVQAVRDKVAAL
ncbi:hypothetical protein JCM8097_001255 [Rhodosporidiobolus ruineniae]